MIDFSNLLTARQSVDIIIGLRKASPDFEKAEITLENEAGRYSHVESSGFDDAVKESLKGKLNFLVKTILVELAVLKLNKCSSDSFKERVTLGLNQIKWCFENAKETQADFTATMNLATQTYRASIATLKNGRASFADLKPPAARVHVTYDFPAKEEMRRCLAQAPQINGPGVRLNPGAAQEKALDALAEVFDSNSAIPPCLVRTKIDHARYPGDVPGEKPFPGNKLPRTVQDPLLYDAVTGCAASKKEERLPPKTK